MKGGLRQDREIKKHRNFDDHVVLAIECGTVVRLMNFKVLMKNRVFNMERV